MRPHFVSKIATSIYLFASQREIIIEDKTKVMDVKREGGRKEREEREDRERGGYEIIKPLPFP